jgi:hypothetical protein
MLVGMMFRFAPADGTRYACVSARERKMGPSVDVTRSEENVLIHRTASGYQVVATPVSMSAVRDGEPLDDALQKMMASMLVVYEVGWDGRLFDISGPDMMPKLLETMPEPLRPMLARMFSKEALFAKNKAEWDGRYADLHGRELAWGGSFDWHGEFESPNGLSMKFWGTTVLAEELEVAGRHCARLRYAYGSNPEGVKALTDRLLRGMEIRGETADWELSGEGERIVEPETMMIHSETTTRKGTIRFDLPGIGSTAAAFEEMRSWTYAYSR